MQTMKIPAFFVLAALALFARTAQADSTVLVDVNTTTCETCWAGPNAPPVNIDAVFTVEQVQGTFWYSTLNAYYTGLEYEVVDITGTINGLAMSLAAPAKGDGSWLINDQNVYDTFSLATVWFTYAGNSQTSHLQYDDFDGNEAVLSNYGDIPINWSAVDPPAVVSPEAGTIVFLAIGLLGVAFAKWKFRQTLLQVA